MLSAAGDPPRTHPARFGARALLTLTTAAALIPLALIETVAATASTPRDAPELCAAPVAAVAPVAAPFATATAPAAAVASPSTTATPASPANTATTATTANTATSTTAPLPSAPPSPAWWQPLGLLTLDEAPSPALAAGRWHVVVFLSHECPVTNQSLPTLAALAHEFTARGVSVTGVYGDPSADLATLRAHARAYAIPFSLALDRAQRLVAFTGATYTPEAVVLSPRGDVLYRGRIDDRVGDFGAARPAAVRTELHDVLTALIAGESGPFKNVAGFGCEIQPPVSLPPATSPGPPISPLRPTSQEPPTAHGAHASPTSNPAHASPARSAP